MDIVLGILVSIVIIFGVYNIIISVSINNEK